jgi:hypothetical protein
LTLLQAGIPVIVFEKNAALFSPGDRDWNIGLHWGVPILKFLISDSAAAQLQSVQVDPNTPTKPIDKLAFLNGRTGSVMTAPEIPNFHRLRRLKLRALLSQGLNIQCNKRLRDIIFEEDGESVTAEFEDGQQVTGRLLIGTDGARPSVRKIVLGPEKASRRDCHIPRLSCKQSLLASKHCFSGPSIHRILQQLIQMDISRSLDYKTRQRWINQKGGHFSSIFLGIRLRNNRMERESHLQTMSDLPR